MAQRARVQGNARPPAASTTASPWRQNKQYCTPSGRQGGRSSPSVWCFLQPLSSNLAQPLQLQQACRKASPVSTATTSLKTFVRGTPWPVMPGNYTPPSRHRSRDASSRSTNDLCCWPLSSRSRSVDICHTAEPQPPNQNHHAKAHTPPLARGPSHAPPALTNATFLPGACPHRAARRSADSQPTQTGGRRRLRHQDSRFLSPGSDAARHESHPRQRTHSQTAGLRRCKPS